MKKFIMLSVVGAMALLVCSCTPASPQARIQERPEDFQRLSEKHQEMVQRGVIEKGMDKNAVYFAWGNPGARAEGFRNGDDSERWDFYGQRAIVSHSPYGGYGYPYGYRDYYRGPYVDIGPEIIHVPYRRASVWFVDGRVNEWERLR